MMLSKEVSEGRPNPFSKRSLRLQRRSPLSLSVLSARQEDWLPSSVASPLSLVKRIKATREVLLSEELKSFIVVTPYYSIKLLSRVFYIKSYINK